MMVQYAGEYPRSLVTLNPNDMNLLESCYSHLYTHIAYFHWTRTLMHICHTSISLRHASLINTLNTLI